jgi:S-adenosyl methyltransferase
MSDQSGKPSPEGDGGEDGGQAPGPDTKHAHSARVYNYWLGGKDNYVEPGVVQPQQWRPDPGALSPLQVTAWCGVARKP